MKRGSSKGVERLPVFSFLAVLVCFMGCLLALLILVGARAQSKATDIGSSAPSAEEDAAQQQKLTELQTYISKLQGVRTVLTEKLAKDRGALAHIEDHTRRLRDQIEQQRLEVQEMQRNSKNQEQSRAGLLAEAVRVEGLVKDSTKLLQETKQQAAKKTSYSVIPYDGPHATRRRPIYLECRADAVIVQPEGIVLRENDFEDSLGPDSPLATAIRAASELVAHDHPEGKVEQAYPLLIVRASGIRAYYAARAMLASWSEDFGYELVDDNWDLKFPPPDPKMAQVLESAVTVARRRMQFNASMQRAAGRGGDNSFSGPGSRGGPAGGEGSGAAGSGGLAEYNGSESGGDGNFGGPGNGGGRGGKYGGTGSGLGTVGGPGQGVPRLTGLNGGTGSGSTGAGGTNTRAGGFRPGNSINGTPGNPIAGGPNGNGSQSNGTGGSTGYRTGGNGLAGNGMAGQPGGVPNGQGAMGGAGGSPGGGGVPGGGMAGSGAQDGAGGPTFPGGIMDPNAAAGAGAGSGGGGGTPGGPMPLGMTAVPEAGMGGDPYTRLKDLKSNKQSLAETRGQNWALLGVSQGAVGVTRPLRIEVAADRIMIDPSEAGAERREIRCTGQTEEAIEQFVSTMWDQMRGWGIAGRGMYWRPVLNLHVLPGGQQRAAELKDLLSGSGLDVKVQP